MSASNAVSSYASFEEHADHGCVVPVVAKVLCEGLTPVALAAYLRHGSRTVYLLESVTGGEKWGRYSFVGFDPQFVLRARGGVFEVLRSGEVQAANLPPGATADGDAWAKLRAVMRELTATPQPGLPRFWGGAVGLVSYDAARSFEPKINGQHATKPELVPEFELAVGGTLVAFDSVEQTVQVIVPVIVRDFPDRKTAYTFGREQVLNALAMLTDAAKNAQLPLLPPPDRGATVPVPQSNQSKAGFLAAIDRAKEHIRAGDIFQVVLSQRFTLEPAGRDPFAIYRMLRASNPSPYTYFLQLPDVTLVGASPESLVRLEDGVIDTRPIAGTRIRGATPEQDLALEHELLADPKECAEHVMLVDLARNDLGRVSCIGSVRVVDRMIVERYSHVMHIVSSVRGELDARHDAIDVLRAAFPAGTLSGAPKVRAMQIIEELEPERRGVYGGAIGYLGFDGNMDMAIAIRTLVATPDAFFIQAGAGIVEASDPEAEYQESLNKARALLVAAECARRELL